MILVLSLLLIFSWIVCAIVSYGGLFAYFQKQYDILAKQYYKRDMIFCLIGSLFGPAALIATMGVTKFKHGLKFR